MKVVIIGSDGQLGGRLMETFAPFNPVGLTHADIEILERGDIDAMIDAYRPEWVISTASYHRVDEVESRPEQALMVNGIGYLNLARACYQKNIGLVCYSTDYVFGGEKQEPYLETDRANPVNAYGISKLVGEHYVSKYAGRFMIIRVSGLFGASGSRSKGGNFVTRMLEKARRRETIRVVNDQIFAPGSCEEISDRTLKLLEIGMSGTFHLVNEGTTNWFEYAKKIFEFARLTPDLVPVTSEEFNAPARRPRYSVLANTRAVDLGVPALSPWEEALKKYIRSVS